MAGLHVQRRVQLDQPGAFLLKLRFLWKRLFGLNLGRFPLPFQVFQFRLFLRQPLRNLFQRMVDPQKISLGILPSFVVVGLLILLSYHLSSLFLSFCVIYVLYLNSLHKIPGYGIMKPS